jgi:hypothetical protein
LLANKILIEKIAAASVNNLPAQIAHQFSQVKKLINQTENEGEDVMKRILELVEKELGSIEGLHDKIADTLHNFVEDTELLKLMEVYTRPEVAKRLLDVQASMIQVLAPIITEAGDRVGKQIIQEFDLD